MVIAYPDTRFYRRPNGIELSDCIHIKASVAYRLSGCETGRNLPTTSDEDCVATISASCLRGEGNQARPCAQRDS